MPPKRKPARRKPIAHVLGRPRTPPQDSQHPFGRRRSGNTALSEDNFDHQEDRFQDPELIRFDNIPPHIVGEESQDSAPAIATQPETQAESTTQNFTDERKKRSHPEEEESSFAEVLQAVKEDNHRTFALNDAGSSLPATRERTASQSDLEDPRPSKLARVENNQEENGDDQVESPLNEPQVNEVSRPVQNIPGTPSNLLGSAWKYNQYILVVLRRNGIIIDRPRLGDMAHPSWRMALQEIDQEIEITGSRPCSEYMPVAAYRDWSTYIHGLQCRSAKRAVKRILAAIAPTRRQLAQENSNFCHLVLIESNEHWINSLVSIQPQPMRSVGIRCDAFTRVELDAILGPDRANTSYHGTEGMLFPLLTFDYNQMDIDIADTQGACCMGLAVKNLVDLHRRANDTEAINKRMSGYSLSFDRREVRIWGYYPVLGPSDSDGVRVYRQLIVHRSLSTPRGLSCDDINGKKNINRVWLFVQKLYEVWIPRHIGNLYRTILLLPEYPPMSESEESQDSKNLV